MQMRRSIIGESQNFTFAPKDTITCSGSAQEGRVDRKPISRSPERLLDSAADPGSMTNRGGACYMSDSDAKHHSNSKR